jgi:hypothetical protein
MEGLLETFWFLIIKLIAGTISLILQETFRQGILCLAGCSRCSPRCLGRKREALLKLVGLVPPVTKKLASQGAKPGSEESLELCRNERATKDLLC